MKKGETGNWQSYLRAGAKITEVVTRFKITRDRRSEFCQNYVINNKSKIRNRKGKG